MSWWVYLEDPAGKGSVEVDRHAEGATYAIGGICQAELNMTYNYSRLFAAAFDGLGFQDALDGRKAKDVLPLLRSGVERLGTERSDDYWQATEGNAGYALSILLAWAEQHPEARFRVS